IVYYVNITLFYHSHIINGITISHSHFYSIHKIAKGEPVHHSHSNAEFIFIKIITQFIATAASGIVLFMFFLLILNEYRSPLKVLVPASFRRSALSLRAPPFFVSSQKTI
ncbi:hypothetical protein N9164_14455, partial [Draconibacterium sp.]|nr:hypothetical protein [Draconibacterium sp.]